MTWRVRGGAAAILLYEPSLNGVHGWLTLPPSPERDMVNRDAPHLPTDADVGGGHER